MSKKRNNTPGFYQLGDELLGELKDKPKPKKKKQKAKSQPYYYKKMMKEIRRSWSRA